MALSKKQKKKEKYSKEFLQEIQRLDFMGQLTIDQIEIAIENGLNRWDLWAKSMKTVPYSEVFHDKTKGIAPVLDGFGNPEQRYYDHYVINNYADFDAYLEKKTAIP